MQIDTSPVRPWEWPYIDSYEWILAQEIQHAVKQGSADARKTMATQAKDDKASQAVTSRRR